MGVRELEPLRGLTGADVRIASQEPGDTAPAVSPPWAGRYDASTRWRCLARCLLRCLGNRCLGRLHPVSVLMEPGARRTCTNRNNEAKAMEGGQACSNIDTVSPTAAMFAATITSAAATAIIHATAVEPLRRA